MGNEKWSGERGQFARERKSVFVTILAASIKKKKKKPQTLYFTKLRALQRLQRKRSRNN